MSFVAAVLAILCDGTQDPDADLRPITLHVAGIHCPSCAGPVRSAIAGMPGVKDIDVSVEDKFLRFTFDAKRTSIQALMRTVLGKDERFPSRLALRLENPKPEPDRLEKARAALEALPGFRALSSPDAEGIVLVTFHLDQATYLPALLKAARDAGLPMGEPPLQKTSK